MKRRIIAVVVAAFCALTMSIPIFGYHSDAEFLPEKLITVEATVRQLEFINPHALIHFEIKDANGNVEQWTAFGGPPNAMTREGWNGQTLKQGDVMQDYRASIQIRQEDHEF